jgi:hypothetical protein
MLGLHPVPDELRSQSFKIVEGALAGYAIDLALAPVTVLGEEPKSQLSSPPKIDHILLELSDLNASIAFCHDFVGLRLKSQSDWFVMLESGSDR